MAKAVAAAKVTRAMHRMQFKDAAGNTVTAVCKERKSGWLTYVDFREKGKQVQRGAVAQHEGQAQAAAIYKGACDTLTKNGWTERPSALASAFTELPKAAKAVQKK